MGSFLSLMIFLFSFSLFAAEGHHRQKVCGDYESKDGSSFLLKENKVALIFLENNFAEFVSFVKTPNLGESYCVEAVVNKKGKVEKVVKAYSMKESEVGYQDKLRDKLSTEYKKAKPTKEKDDSRSNRVGLNYQVLYGLGAEYRISGNSELTFAKFLTENQVVSVKLGAGRGHEIQQNNVTFQYKHFLENSFYIAPEIYYLNLFEKNYGSGYPYVDRLTAIGAMIRIGNQWQWQNFTLGCDWIGLGYNFININNDFDRDERSSTAAFLKLYLGYSF